MVLTEQLVDTMIHEALHALGHPSSFDRSGLNSVNNVFNQVNFVGDFSGINGIGYGLTEFRAESGNPLAQVVPLAQTDVTAPGETPGHLSDFEPTWVRLDEGLLEGFTTTAPPPGVRNFMSKTVRGMFADLGYRVRGVNAPGSIDLDDDGVEDDPLITNPIFGDHN